MQELGKCFAGSLHRFLPLILSPWFVFGGSGVSLKEVISAAQGHLPDTITLKLGNQITVTLLENVPTIYEGTQKKRIFQVFDSFLLSGHSVAQLPMLQDFEIFHWPSLILCRKDVADFVVATRMGGANLLGVLHSLGYTRGLLEALRFPEERRIESMLRFALLGDRPSGASASLTSAEEAWVSWRVRMLGGHIRLLSPLARALVHFTRAEFAPPLWCLAAVPVLVGAMGTAMVFAWQKWPSTVSEWRLWSSGHCEGCWAARVSKLRESVLRWAIHLAHQVECLEIQAFHCACAQRPTVTARFKTISCWADSFHFKSVYLCREFLLELFSLGRSASELFHPCFATAQGGACQGSKTSRTVTPRKPPLMDALIPCQYHVNKLAPARSQCLILALLWISWRNAVGRVAYCRLLIVSLVVTCSHWNKSQILYIWVMAVVSVSFSTFAFCKFERWNSRAPARLGIQLD